MGEVKFTAGSKSMVEIKDTGGRGDERHWGMKYSGGIKSMVEIKSTGGYNPLGEGEGSENVLRG